ncbi:competence protein ComEC [Belliella buryatensis]|uniref:Competence protein ComEC n=2 Tax=Belliella buryatensis TaxID=1500549 RepID=A0A239BBC4_9BACT|nr:competence protein ComEC [Belliella buryatensis]
MKGSFRLPFFILLLNLKQSFSRMIFSEFPFLRHTLFLILGILLYQVLGSQYFILSVAFLVFIYFIYAILIIWNRLKKQYNFRILIPLFAYLQLILLGYVITYLKDFKNDADHLIHQKQEIKGYIAVVLGNDEVKPNSIANRLRMIELIDESFNPIAVTGEVLIYHRLEHGLKSGDLVFVVGEPELLTPPTNPAEFHYQRFMQRQQIAHRHFVGNRILKIGYRSTQPVEDFFLDIRSAIIASIDAKFRDTQAKQVAQALLLGQKKNLEKEVSEAYVTAGAMHVLAVSGLHVGIIYGFFFLFFKPYRMKQGARIVYLSIIILIIWAYAMLTGMSPSVMRAATMFSLMALAQMKSRSPSIFNAIALSALLLLIFDPFLIYSVGFQLSYLALIGIILIQPILVSIWIPKWRVVEYIWQISMVGLAAQLMTFPISTYYFHVFPTYFLISNLVAIPGAFLIMSVGIPMMLCFQVPVLGQSLAWMTEHLISFVNFLIFGIQSVPYARISHINLSSEFMIFYWLILALLISLFLNRKKWMLYVGFVAMFIFGGYQVIHALVKNEKTLIFYEVSDGIALDYGQSYYLDFGVPEAELSFKVFPNRSSSLKSLEPLTVFLKGDSLVIPLPKLKQPMYFYQGDWLNQSDFSMNQYAWTGDAWRESNKNELQPKIPTARKLVFK